jgi:hypothetical protein
MRRVFFVALLAFVVSSVSSVEAVACSVHFRDRHHVVTCPNRPDASSGLAILAQAKLDAQRIKDEAQRVADEKIANADKIVATAQQQRDTIKANATLDADAIRARASQDAAKTIQDAENIKASAQREKHDTETLLAGAVATQKSAADQIDQANRSKQEFDKQTQELKDKISAAEDAKRKAEEAQTVFEGTTRVLEAERKRLAVRFDRILRADCP